MLASGTSAAASDDPSEPEPIAEAGAGGPAPARLLAELRTDNERYTDADDVLFIATVENAGEAGAYLELVIEVADSPEGPPVFQHGLPAFDLAPGSFEQRVAVFAGRATAPGEYLARLMLVRDGEPVAIEHAAFTIGADAGTSAALTGRLQVEPQVVSEGDAVALRAEVDAAAGLDTRGFSAEFSLLDPHTGTRHLHSRQSFEATAGQQTSLFAMFDTPGVGLGPRVAVLRAMRRGSSTPLWTLFAPFSVVDTTAPVVRVAAPDCAAHDVLPFVSVIETHRAREHYRIDGSPAPNATLSAEGAHLFEVLATDPSGNEGRAQASIIIDRTPPTIDIDGVQEGQLSQKPVVPTIAIHDANLVSSTLRLDGEPYAPGDPIATEGTRRLVVSAVDCAGNRSIVERTFEIDTQPPRIRLATASCSSSDLAPEVTIEDAHPGEHRLRLDGAAFEGTTIHGEGAHVFEATATDRAGNEGRARVAFILDRTAPTIEIGGVRVGLVSRTPVVPVVNATDAHPMQVASTLNGEPYVSGTPVSAPGEYLLAAEAQDCAGNHAKTAAAFSIDTTLPAVTIQVPACTGTDVSPVVAVVEQHPGTTRSFLDGVPFTAGPVHAEGAHELRVEATDAAGNQAASSARFVIDRTPPQIAIGGVEEGAMLQHPVTPRVTLSEPNLATRTLTLDGQPFDNGTEVSADGAHTLTVHALDCAGNEARRSVTFTIDTTPPGIAIDVPSCTNSDVVPTIRVVEPNLAQQRRLLDGAGYAGGPVSAERSHELIVEVSDRAGHHSATRSRFIIDRTTPDIGVLGVYDGAIVSETVTPQVVVTDANLTDRSLTLDGRPYISGTPIDGEGHHELLATATDCAGNATSRSFKFEIRRIAGAVSQAMVQGPLGRPRVMLGLDAGSRDDSGPAQLRSALAGAGIGYEEALGRPAWQRALRSGRFHAYILYLPRASDSEQLAEFNEAVWLCEGLALIASGGDAMPNLREALGLDFGDTLPGPQTVTLESPLGGGSLAPAGVGTLRLGRATAIATAEPTHERAVVAARNALGLGQSVTVAWDTETTGSAALYAAILSAITPGPYCAPLPGGAADLRIQVENRGVRTTTYTVSHGLADGLTSDDAPAHLITVEPGQRAEFNLGLRLPTTPGEYPVTASLTADDRELDRDVLVVRVPYSAATLASSITSTLKDLSLSARDRTQADNAAALLASAAQRSHPHEAIDDLLAAIDDVRQIESADVNALRIELARLLRIYQLRWEP